MRKITVLIAALLALSLAGCRWIAPYLPGLTKSPDETAATRPVRTVQTTAAAQPTGMLETSPAPTPQQLSREELVDVFVAVAAGSEYGSSSSMIRKWTQPVRIAMHGNPTEEDAAALQRAIGWLNSIEGFPGIEQVASGANANIWFVREEEMKDVMEGYVENNWGFFWTYSGDETITSVTIAIATDVTDQLERNHLIFEELIQSTGLMRDIDTHEDSIFYTHWTTVQEPSSMDRELVSMLYLPEVKHGSTVEEAVAVIRTERLFG